MGHPGVRTGRKFHHRVVRWSVTCPSSGEAPEPGRAGRDESRDFARNARMDPESPGRPFVTLPQIFPKPALGPLQSPARLGRIILRGPSALIALLTVPSSPGGFKHRRKRLPPFGRAHKGNINVLGSPHHHPSFNSTHFSNPTPFSNPIPIFPLNQKNPGLLSQPFHKDCDGGFGRLVWKVAFEGRVRDWKTDPEGYHFRFDEGVNDDEG